MHLNFVYKSCIRHFDKFFKSNDLSADPWIFLCRKSYHLNIIMVLFISFQSFNFFFSYCRTSSFT